MSFCSSMDRERIEETIKELEKAKTEFAGDTEAIHIEFDRIICDLLIELGYRDVVDIYNETSKWYA